MPAVNLLKIPVTDVGQAVRFYEAALGLSATVVVEQYGWAELDGASVPLALYVPGRGGGDRVPGGSVDFHLSHTDLDELLEQVRSVTATTEIHENDDGTRSLEFRDPAGNVVKVMQRT